MTDGYAVQAINLFKNALINNNATLDFSLAECIFYYVPKMLCMHRSYWTEEHLLIIRTNQEEEFSDHLNTYMNNMYCYSKLYLYSITHDNVDEYLRKIVGWNIQVDGIDIPDEVMPSYYKIDPQEFIKIMVLI
jgi:hypothetical protein